MGLLTHKIAIKDLILTFLIINFADYILIDYWEYCVFCVLKLQKYHNYTFLIDKNT